MTLFPKPYALFFHFAQNEGEWVKLGHVKKLVYWLGRARHHVPLIQNTTNEILNCLKYTPGKTKEHKNCESCPAQVTWKVKLDTDKMKYLEADKMRGKERSQIYSASQFKAIF